MAKSLEQALKSLDTKNDDHWTADGAPRMDVLQELTGDDKLTRKQVNDFAANFSKDNPTLEKGDDPKPSGDTAQGTDANPTHVGETNDEVKGDEDVGVVGDDPENPDSPDVKVADEDDDQVDADGTVTATAENERNEGRPDEAKHIDVDGNETESRENQELLDQVDAPIPQNADGSITSNRQTNDEDEARRAGFKKDQMDEEVNKLERTDPSKASEDDQDEIDSLEEELEEAEAELRKEEEALNDVRNAIARKRAKRDALVERRERRVDRHADQRDRMAFIKKQQEQRAARAGEAELAKKLAMEARGIAASPLDRAMADRPRQTRTAPAKSE